MLDIPETEKIYCSVSVCVCVCGGGGGVWFTISVAYMA